MSNVRPWNLLQKSQPRADEKEYEHRLDICNSCPSLKAGVCTSCGCVVRWKAKLLNAVCPEGKWGVIQDEEKHTEDQLDSLMSDRGLERIHHEEPELKRKTILPEEVIDP